MCVKRPPHREQRPRTLDLVCFAAAITVSVRCPSGGRRTGASIQPAPVASRRRRACALHWVTLIVEK